MKKYTGIALLMAVAFIYACTSSSKENLITGTWTFAQKENDNKKVTFNKDNTCVSTNVADGKIDTIASFQYKITNNGKTLITIDPTSDRKSDTVEIVELTTKVFKIKTPAGDTIALKKD